MDVADFLLKLGGATGSGVLAFVVWAFITDRIVTRRMYQDQVARADKWEAFATKNLHLAERAVATTDKATVVAATAMRTTSNQPPVAGGGSP